MTIIHLGYRPRGLLLLLTLIQPVSKVEVLSFYPASDLRSFRHHACGAGQVAGASLIDDTTPQLLITDIPGDAV